MQISSSIYNEDGIQKPILVGHSFGGKIVIRIASKKDIPLSGLVLVDASGLPHTSFTTQAKINIAKTVKPIMSLPFMKGIKSNLLRLSGSDDYIAFRSFGKHLSTSSGNILSLIYRKSRIRHSLCGAGTIKIRILR